MSKYISVVLVEISMSSSSTVPSKELVNKKNSVPDRGPFGQMYNPDGSVYRDYPCIIQSTALGSPPGIRPSTLNTTSKSFLKSIGNASVRERIIVQLLKIQPLTLLLKLRTISSVQLALLVLVTLTDDDPTGIINGDSCKTLTTFPSLPTSQGRFNHLKVFTVIYSRIASSHSFRGLCSRYYYRSIYWAALWSIVRGNVPSAALMCITMNHSRCMIIYCLCI